MTAALLLAFLCGAGFHALLVAVALALWSRTPPPVAPPAARHTALDIRPAMHRRPYVPPASVGVRVVRGQTPTGEPPSFLPDVQALDEEPGQ